MRLRVATAAAVGAGASWALLAASRPSNELTRRPTDATARLRRHSTRTGPYCAGQRVSIVRVPQRLAGVDVGHIAVLVGQDDGTLASLGFYSRGYRAGLPVFTRDAGVLLSPDPVYARAVRERLPIDELYCGRLSEAQAERLNLWTDDQAAGPLALSRFTTSAGEERELAVARLDGERYAGIAALLPGTENCATFAEKLFPSTIACPCGLPRWCQRIAAGDQRRTA